MARRWKEESDSSLELLLDTVCNAFGGIIFIVLLLSVLPSQSSGSNQQSQATTSQMAELTRLRIEIEQQENLAKLHQATASALASPEAERDLRQKEQLEAKRAFLQHALESQQKSDAELQATLVRETAETERLKRLRARLESAIVKGEQDRRSDEVVQTRLPRLRAIPGKHRYFLILYQNRVYLTLQMGTTSYQVFPNEEDLRITQDGFAKTFVPLVGRGIPVDEWIKSPQGVARFRGQFSEDRWVINLCIYGDSLETFNRLRNAFTERGYDYNWHPLTEGAPLQLVPDSGPAEAQ